MSVLLIIGGAVTMLIGRHSTGVAAIGAAAMVAGWIRLERMENR